MAILLTVAGNQVPVMPLFEVVGKTGAFVPLQKAGIGVNAGMIKGFTITFTAVLLALALQVLS